MRKKINFIGLILVLGLFVSGCVQKTKIEDNAEQQSNKPDAVMDQLDVLNQKIQKDSLNPGLFDERAKFYMDKEQYNEAYKDITTALELDSSYYGYYVTLSDVLLSMGKLKKSVKALDKSIELNDENPDAYLRLAEISVVIKDYKKALGYIDKALKVDELQPKGYLLRGVVMLENGDTIRAIRNFQKAIDVDQDYFNAHMQLAQLYAGKKNDLAIDYYNNALNIQPDNEEAKYSLAMYYQETDRYDKAIQLYNQLLEKDPEFYIALYNIGYINLVYKKNYDEAIDYFTKAIDIHSDYVEAYYNRGFAYELNKDVDNSYKDYKKVLELHPNFDKAIEGLNRIENYQSGAK